MSDTPVEPSVELVMSEFGPVRQNAGGGRLCAADRMNPTLNSFRRIFPSAKVTLYTDQPLQVNGGVHAVHVNPPFSRTERRYGWRSHDYHQAAGLLGSSADIAIAMDSDMQIVSDGFRTIAKFAEMFGLAVPLNPRLLLRIDGGIGADSTYVAADDDTLGLGLTYNLTPIAFSTRNENARAMLERYSQLLRQSPGRGAVHLVQASYELGYQPFVLPPQWCVCSPRDLDSKHLWREAIVLHIGHHDVLPRWRREMLKQKARGFVGKVWGR
jgi:hypothetical protein